MPAAASHASSTVIDDATRAGILSETDLPGDAVAVLGASASARIGRMVADVVQETMAGDYRELRMSPQVLDATLTLRSFRFDAVYENESATTEFRKATGILGGLWEAVRARPDEFLDRAIIDKDGLDTAVCDFVAGMTDRYAISLYERLFIPTPWVG